MKRPVFLIGMPVILMFCFCFWGLAPKKKELAASPPVAALEPKSERPIESAGPSRTANAAISSDSKPLLTDTRRSVMDSRDLMKTVTEIRLHGTPDEKDWAVTILLDCINVHARGVQANGTPASEPESIHPIHEPDVARERVSAFRSVTERCAGLYALSPSERRALKSDLLAGAAANPSDLAKLHALSDSDENRWSDDQANLVSRSLYSGDPIFQQEAYYAARRGFDSDAPGGEDRLRAWDSAFRSEIGLRLTTDLELQTACVLINHCPSSAPDEEVPRQLGNGIDRLVSQYKAALQAHKDVRSILAIR